MTIWLSEEPPPPRGHDGTPCITGAQAQQGLDCARPNQYSSR
jgi:hypothetical protein